MTLPRLCFLLLLLCPRISAQEAEVTVADYPAFVGQGGCGADEFRCNSGTCIPFAQVRDCNNDCPDAEDEACPESTPLATWTLCDDALPCENRRGPRGCGRCALRVNQAFPSCLDRYFEGNVNVLGFKPCATTVNWVPEMPPDGEDDCGDGTDEDACLIPDFTGQTACPGQACVFDRCAVPWPSGFNQYLGPFPATTTAAIVCSPLATTAAPTTPSPTMAPPAPSDPCAGAPGFACTDGSACVPTDQINDGTAQCGDASDELCLDPAAAAALCPSGGSCLYDPASETFGCACPANTLPNDRSVCLPDFASLPGDCSEVGTTGTAVVYRDDPTCVTLADCQAVVECPDAAGSSLGLDPSTPLGPGWTLVAENLEAGGPKSGAEYEQGFNDSLTKTTFAGLEYLDRLTGDPAALPELAVLVEFENASIPPKLIKYESFEVGPKASDYALVLGNQVTEQGLGSLVNGAPFSTSDSGSASSCASSTNVSWWWADSCDAQASLAPVPGLILGGQVVKDVKVLAKPPVECAPDEWECTELGECVPQTAVADGTANCFDGTDEAACGGDAALAATCDPDGCVFVPSAGAFQCAPCPELTKLSGSRCEPNTAALPSDCSQTALTGPTAVYNQQGCSTVAECKAADVICPAVGGSGETVVPADSGLGSGWTMIARSGSGGQLNPAAVLNKTLDEFGTGFGSPDAGPFVAGMDYASELTGAQPTEAAVLVTLSDGSKRIVRYAEVEVADKAGEYALTVGPQADVAAATAALGSSLQSGPLSTADSGQGQDCAATLGLGWWLSGAADCATAARDSMAPAAGLQVDGLEVTDVQLLLRPTQECGSAFACADGNGCAVLSSVRDGRPDCLDGSDEDPGCGLAQGATPACNPATCVFDPTIAEFACPPCPAQYAADEGLRCRPDFGALPLDCTHPSAPSAGGAFDVYADDGLCMTLDDCRLTVQCQPDPADPASPQDWILVKEQAAPASTPPPNDWATYAGGFGSVGSGSYFVGLDDLRKLALQGPMKLRLALTPSDPALDPVYLDYEDFALGTEAEGYALSLGTLVQESLSPPKDLLRASVGEPFSTADRGPDAECASSTGVGWWFPAPCGKDGTCGPCDEEGNLGEMPGQVVWDGVPMDAVRILLQPIPRNACQKQGQFQCKFVTSQCIDDRFVIDGNQLECDPNVPGDECKCLDRSDENFCAFDPAFRQLRDCEADLGTRCVYNSERHEFNCQCPPGTFGNTTARDRFCLPDPTALPRNCEEVAALDPEARSQTTTIYPMVDKRNCLSRKQCESPTFCELGDLAGFGPGWTVIQSRSLQGPTFDRTAQDFAKGFGRPTGDDFYIGNEAVKELTMVGRQDVLLELTSPSGEKRYVKYNDFAVGPAPDYPLALGAQASGSGDDLSGRSGSGFSARDGGAEAACAADQRSGWWLAGGCSLDGQLNGPLWDGSGRSGSGFSARDGGAEAACAADQRSGWWLAGGCSLDGQLNGPLWDGSGRSGSGFSARDGGAEAACAADQRSGWWLAGGCSLDGQLNGPLWDGSGRSGSGFSARDGGAEAACAADQRSGWWLAGGCSLDGQLNGPLWDGSGRSGSGFSARDGGAEAACAADQRSGWWLAGGCSLDGQLNGPLWDGSGRSGSGFSARDGGAEAACAADQRSGWWLAGGCSLDGQLNGPLWDGSGRSGSGFSARDGGAEAACAADQRSGWWLAGGCSLDGQLNGPLWDGSGRSGSGFSARDGGAEAACAADQRSGWWLAGGCSLDGQLNGPLWDGSGRSGSGFSARDGGAEAACAADQRSGWWLAGGCSLDGQLNGPLWDGSGRSGSGFSARDGGAEAACAADQRSGWWLAGGCSLDGQLNGPLWDGSGRSGSGFSARDGGAEAACAADQRSGWWLAGGCSLDGQLNGPLWDGSGRSGSGFSARDGGAEAACAADQRSGWWLAGGCSLDGQLNGPLWDGSGRPSVLWDGAPVAAVRMLTRKSDGPLPTTTAGPTEPPVVGKQPIPPAQAGAGNLGAAVLSTIVFALFNFVQRLL